MKEKETISEIIIVGGQEIEADEIRDMWHSSNEGDYLELKGNKQIPIPKEEVEKVRDFFEHMRDVDGKHRKLNFDGEYVYENEILDVVYQNETPYLKLTENRLLEIKPIQVDAVMWIVTRNKKLKGEY